MGMLRWIKSNYHCQIDCLDFIWWGVMDHLDLYSVYSQMSMQYHILKLVLAVHAMSIHKTEI